MNKTIARILARAAYSPVMVVAAGKGGKSWGYNVIINERGNWTTISCGSYRRAVECRAEGVRTFIDELLNEES